MFDQDSLRETEDPAVLEIRRKYLKAFGVGMGLDEEDAEQNATRLLNTRKMLANIDISKSLRNANPKEATQIESVGRWLLEGNDEGKYQPFYLMRCYVLGLLRDTPESVYFTDLQDRVRYWTDGKGVEAFQKSLQK